MKTEASASGMRSLLISSVMAPTYAGGLAAYSRILGSEMSQCTSFTGGYACISYSHPTLPSAQTPVWPVRSLMSPSLWRILRKIVFSRMGSRPSAHALLEAVMQIVLPGRKLKELFGVPSVIHYVGTGWDFLGFALAHFARQTGSCFTIWPAVHPGTWGDDAVDVRLYEQADTVFCQSQDEAARLEEKGLRPEQLLRCGLPPMCLADGQGRRLGKDMNIHDRPTVLFLGRRDKGKGYPALLQAWRRVVAEVPGAVLLLAGPGGEKWKAMIGELPESAVCDLEVPTEQTKADLLDACDVLCVPSAHESFGIVYVEAWSYGKPVICGTAPACRELVEDGKTGVWSEGTPESIAEKLIWLLRQPALCSEMGEAGRRLQRALYTPSTMLTAHLNAWGSAANSYR